jgi:hypothetical protein
MIDNRIDIHGVLASCSFLIIVRLFPREMGVEKLPTTPSPSHQHFSKGCDVGEFHFTIDVISLSNDFSQACLSVSMPLLFLIDAQGTKILRRPNPLPFAARGT